jgi:hypothetical protein
MRFLERHDDGPAGAWWKAVADYPGGAPGIVGELLRTSRSVVCDDVEAEQAVAWAQAHPAWTDHPPPWSWWTRRHPTRRIQRTNAPVLRRRHWS